MQEKQVKVNTATGAYRFNQKGQLIETITAPFVNVDASTREDLEALYDDVRAVRDGGGNGSIIGRNTFQRPKAEALAMLARFIEIYQGKA